MVSDEESVTTDEEITKGQIWHMRLDRISEVDLKNLSKHGLFGGDQISKIQF